jgi:CheY-like chemotaxis protein
VTLINHRSNGRHEADISIPRHLANAEPNTTPLRALLVDDKDHFVQTVRDHLERDGINAVGIATTPAEALRQTGSLTPNVALIDIMLGAEFGFDLADTLTQAVLKPRRMIMMSTYAESDFAGMLDASPAIGFLPKAWAKKSPPRSTGRGPARYRPSDDPSAIAAVGIVQSADGAGRTDTAISWVI